MMFNIYIYTCTKVINFVRSMHVYKYMTYDMNIPLITLQHQHTCAIPKNISEWTVHGLWYVKYDSKINLLAELDRDIGTSLIIFHS